MYKYDVFGETTQGVSACKQVLERCVGMIVGWGEENGILVDYPGNTKGPQVARITASLLKEGVREAFQPGDAVLLFCADGKAGGPVIVDTVLSSRLESNELRDDHSDLRREATVDPIANVSEKEHVKRGAYLANIAFTHEGQFYVEIEGISSGPIRVLTAIAPRDLVHRVIVLFLENGEPVIIGQVCDGEAKGDRRSDQEEILIAGSKVRIEAKDSITLIANRTQYHLDGRGKITETADTIVSRARGANKVQGGSVQLN